VSCSSNLRRAATGTRSGPDVVARWRCLTKCLCGILACIRDDVTSCCYVPIPRHHDTDTFRYTTWLRSLTHGGAGKGAGLHGARHRGVPRTDREAEGTRVDGPGRGWRGAARHQGWAVQAETRVCQRLKLLFYDVHRAPRYSHGTHMVSSNQPPPPFQAVRP
jgi:hypothetical protein